MDSRRIEAKFDEIVDLGEAERLARLTELEHTDPEIAREVRELLAFDPGEVSDRGVQVIASSSEQTHARTVGLLQPGDDIDSYRILREVGRGGMGTVYLADQSSPVERRVALKMIRHDTSDVPSQEAIRRFEQERDTLARMDHPSIPRIFDAGTTDDGRRYFAMEYVDGVPITDWCRARRLAFPELLGLFARVCRAVQHAHEKGAIHRDLKPSNILVSELDGAPTPKLIDFGIARPTTQPAVAMTATGQFVGTFEYMSPEQVRGGARAIDTRSDVYSLGLVLYELLVGEPPLDRSPLEQGDLAGWQRTVLEVDPPRASQKVGESRATTTGLPITVLRHQLRGDLDNILRKALEKDRERRYASAAALADDLDRYVRNEPISATSPSRFYLVQKFVQRHRVTVVFASLLLFSLVLGLAGTTWGYFRARRETARAESKADEAKANLETAALESKRADEKAALAVTRAEEAQRNFDESILVTRFLEEVLAGGTDESNTTETTLREAVEVAARRADEELREVPRGAAMVHHVVARAFLRLRDFERARAHLQRAYELNEPFATDDGRRLGLHRVICLLLSEVTRRSGDVATSLSWVERGLEIPPSEDEDVGVLRSLKIRLGRTYAEQNRLDEADAALRDALASPGEADEALSIRSDLALVLARRGKREEAVEILREVSTERLRRHGPNHTFTCAAQNNHASILRSLGRLSEAEVEYERAAAAARNLWGDRSPELARAVLGLAHISRTRGLRVLAAERYRLALEIMEGVHGEGSLAALTVRNSLGSLLGDLGELEEAERILRVGLDALTAAGGGTPNQLEKTLTSLAEVLIDRNELDEAEEVLGRALEISARLAPRGSPYHGTLWVRYADLARRRGNLALAAERLERASLAHGRPTPEVDDPSSVPPTSRATSAIRPRSIPTVSWGCSAARIALASGDLDQAQSLARETWALLDDSTSLLVWVHAIRCVVELPIDRRPSTWSTDTRQVVERIRQIGDDDPWIAELEAYLASGSDSK